MKSQPIRHIVQNTGNQDAHKNGEYGHKMKEQMKATQTEIKQNIQGTKVKGRKPGLKSTVWTRMKK